MACGLWLDDAPSLGVPLVVIVSYQFGLNKIYVWTWCGIAQINPTMCTLHKTIASSRRIVFHGTYFKVSKGSSFIFLFILIFFLNPCTIMMHEKTNELKCQVLCQKYYSLEELYFNCFCGAQIWIFKYNLVFYLLVRNHF